MSLVLYRDDESLGRTHDPCMRTCTKCHNQKPEDRFAKFRGRDGIERPRGACYECRKKADTRSFQEQQEYRTAYNLKNKTVRQQKSMERRAESRDVIDNLKRAPCTDCLRTFPPVAMDFDHIGPKTMGIASMLSTGYKLHLILEEIKQCELVCACCHRIRTASRKQNLFDKTNPSPRLRAAA